MKNQMLLLALLAGVAAATALHAADAVTEPVRDRGEFMTDAGISTKVKASLLTEKNLKSLRIDVETKNGVVTLRGTVSDAAEIRQAGDVARHVKGVKGVRNELRLQTAKSG